MRTEQPTKCLYHIGYGIVSVMFYLMFVHYTFSSALVAEWPSLENSCALGRPFVHFVFCLFVFYLFSILVLRASAITMPELMEINLVTTR